MLKCKEALSEPLEAVPVEGEVVIFGTGAGATAVTAEAALETCKRVLAAAEEALRQRAEASS